MARSLLLVCLWAVVLLVAIEKCPAGADEQTKEDRASQEVEPEDSTASQSTSEATASPSQEVKPEDSTASQATSEAPASASQEVDQEDSTASQATSEAPTSPSQEVEPENSTASQATSEAPGSPSQEVKPEDSTASQATSEAPASPSQDVKPEDSTARQSTSEAPSSPSQEVKPEDSTASQATSEAPASSSQEVKPEVSTASQAASDCKEKLKECENTKTTSCKQINGTATCVCPPSMKETENGDCFVAKTLTIKFKLKSRQKRSATSSDKNLKCAMDRDELIREIKLIVPSVIEESIVCEGSDVAFDAFAENEEKEKEITGIFEKCKQASQPDGCNLGANISIEPASAEVLKKDLCQDEAYKKLAKEMGIICQYDKETRMVCNNETAIVIGKAHVQGIPFEVCKAIPCTKTTCDGKKHCVQGSCVCKPQYRNEDGECKSMCEVTPSVCPVGATCVLGQGDQSFYCECPPKLTGPLCTRENKPLQTAKLNIVVVGVVLASLLLLCFVVSASIISRLRKKAQGPSFSKDCERRPQRELRGYDGPYKASDPASLHRGRDHTSL